MEILTIPTIAAWARPRHSPWTFQPERLAVLPVLQRGPVWKPEQVERLWDSLVRGLPIGSFLLSNYEMTESLGAKGYSTQGRSSSTAPKRPDWHLLDGQQRVTAIALGFLNPWTIPRHPEIHDLHYALWVDLDSTGRAEDCDFVFRMVTRSHPWGYQRRSPKETLSLRNRRSAIQDLERVRGSTFKLGTLPIEAVPYDAIAPVPLASLLSCIHETNVWQALRREVERNDGRVAWKTGQRDSLYRLLAVEPTREMRLLKEGLWRLIADGPESYQVGGLVVPDQQIASSDSKLRTEDPIATLFIRVNSAGTVPGPEEMSYSLLKSVWPQCHDLIDELPHSFLPPAQMVVQLATLIIAQADIEGSKGPPRFPDLAGFRRLVYADHDQHRDFPDRFRSFIASSQPKELVGAAGRILLLRNDGKPDERPFRLMPAQAAQLARSSRRLFLLFLAWVDSRLDQEGEWLGLDEEAHRRVLGLMTAISWFGQSEEDCVAVLWPFRAELHEPGLLRRIIGVREGRLSLLPLPPPDILRITIQERVTGLEGVSIYNSDPNDQSNVWNSWRFWSHFANSPREDTALGRWYLDPANLPLDRGVEDAGAWQSQAWARLANALKSKRELILYAQRKTLNSWFGGHDATSPNQLEDTDRPWDFDHIHPGFFTGAWHVPQIIKDWHGSIGNIRAWPAELNRSDTKDPPSVKLCDPDDRERVAYGLKGQADILTASAIKEGQLTLWIESCPVASGRQYLAGGAADNGQYVPNRIALLRAITNRWLYLYETWFDELRLAQQLDASKGPAIEA